MTTVDTARPAGEVLDSCRVRVEPALRAAVDALPSSMQRIVGYHLGWWEEDGRPTGAAGGKAIRPALTLLSAATVGGTADSAIPAAVAVELVHNFSLLHDDVMDRDLTRRHRPTAWAVFGTGPAILAGDSLLALAMDVLAASGHPAAERGTRMLSAAVQDLVNGQIADLAFEQRTDVGLSECLDMAGNKTGALLGCASAVGALFGNGGFDEVGAMERFGRELGVAFQIVDDLLGIWGDPVATGKAADTDLRCRKKTLPVVAALTSGTPAGRELDELYHREQELSDAELARAAELVELAGGRAWCHDRVGDLMVEALRRLPVAATPTASEAVAELGTLAQLIARRDH
ncbi:MAG: family 2 encapsulin nanocompartment cargo protein polyprenyl transferase [Pseudonocardia sp.]